VKKYISVIALLFMLVNSGITVWAAAEVDNQKLLDETSITVKNESSLLPGGWNIFGKYTMGSYWQVELIDRKWLDELGWSKRWLPFGIGDIIYTANTEGTWDIALNAAWNGAKEGLELGVGKAFEAVNASKESIKTLERINKVKTGLEAGDSSIQEAKVQIKRFGEKVDNEETSVTTIKLLSYAVMKNYKSYLDASDWNFINMPFVDAPLTQLTVPGKVFPNKENALLLRSQMYLDIMKKSEFVELSGFRPSSDGDTLRALTLEIHRYLSQKQEGRYTPGVYTSYVQELIENYFIDSIIYEMVEEDHSLFLNGYTINNTTMVPLRDIFEALSANVSWDEATQTAVAKKDGKVLTLSLGSLNVMLDGRGIQIDEAPVIIDGKTYVPVRVVSESMDSIVAWKGKTRTAVIDGKIYVKVLGPLPQKPLFNQYKGSWGYRNATGNYGIFAQLDFSSGANATVTLSAGYAPEKNPAAARQSDSTPAQIVFSKDGIGTFKYVDAMWLGEGKGTIQLKNNEIILTIVREKGESYFFDGTYHLKR